MTGRLLRSRRTNTALTIDQRQLHDYGHLIAYDGDNQAVYEQDNGPNPSAIHRFGGEWYDSVSDSVRMALLPILHVSDGDFQWKFLDQDGHALAVYDAQGNELQYEVTGVYGARLDDYHFQYDPTSWLNKPWEMDGLHGQEVNHDMGTVHRGIRDARRRAVVAAGAVVGAGLTHEELQIPGALTGVGIWTAPHALPSVPTPETL